MIKAERELLEQKQEILMRRYREYEAYAKRFQL